MATIFPPPPILRRAISDFTKLLNEQPSHFEAYLSRGLAKASLGDHALAVKDYDRAIGMLEMSIDNEVEITSLEFQHYIQDDWGWKNSFLLSNTKYLKH